jgi:hypothetical protein
LGSDCVDVYLIIDPTVQLCPSLRATVMGMES